MAFPLLSHSLVSRDSLEFVHVYVTWRTGNTVSPAHRGGQPGSKQAGRSVLGVSKTDISAAMCWLLHVTQSKRVLLETCWSLNKPPDQGRIQIKLTRCSSLAAFCSPSRTRWHSLARRCRSASNPSLPSSAEASARVGASASRHSAQTSRLNVSSTHIHPWLLLLF